MKYNPTPWRGKPRKKTNPMYWFRRFCPVGYEWTFLTVVTLHWWLTIPMYLIETWNLEKKRKVKAQPVTIEGTARPITSGKITRWEDIRPS